MSGRSAQDIEIYVEIDRVTRHEDGRPRGFHCTDGVNQFWLPASQVTATRIKNNDFEVVMPEWLARKKGVI